MGNGSDSLSSQVVYGDEDDKSGTLTFGFARDELNSIHESRLVKVGTVPVRNQSGALFMIDAESGRKYVVKRRQSDTNMRGEAVGYVLSKALGVRTPRAAVVRGKDSLGWASEVVDHASGWRPDDASQCDPTDLANIFVLDAILGNSDRHQDNVLVVDPGGNQMLQVYSIDLANSWLGGGAPDGPIETLDVPERPQFLSGVDAETLESNAGTILDAAAGLASDASAISGITYAANIPTKLDTKARRDALEAALKLRLKNAHALFTQHLGATLKGELP